jgi:hypothetical protein
MDDVNVEHAIFENCPTMNDIIVKTMGFKGRKVRWCCRL